MSKKELNTMPEGLTKPAPPPRPPSTCELFVLDDEIFLMGMTNVEEACDEIIASRKVSIEAKTAALDLQLATLRMKVLIMEEEFWEKDK
jgi:hypothetical protein